MHRGLRAAIIVEIFVLVLAIVLSVVYFQLGLFRYNRGIGIGLVVLWVLVAALLLVVFWVRSLQREEIVRRFYLSDTWIYNHEIGYAPLSKIVPDGDAYEFVTFAAVSLAEMSYGFEIAEAPEHFRPSFLIDTRTFRFHLSGEDGSVVDEWSGVLQRVDEEGEDGNRQLTDLGTFANAGELARLLEDNEAFFPEDGEAIF